MQELSAVQEHERRGDVSQVRAGQAIGNGNELGHVVPVEELHRVERKSLVEPVVVDTDDSRVLERREGVILALEENRESLASRVFEAPLQGELAPRHFIVRAEDDPHAATRDLLEKPVAVRNQVRLGKMPPLSGRLVG